MAVTLAPSAASASLNSPPPQPTSSTVAPFSAMCSATKASRTGFRSCSGLLGPSGSHHLCARRSKRAISAGSTLVDGAGVDAAALTATSAGLAAARQPANTLAPAARAGDQVGAVHVLQLAIRQALAAGDPDIGNLVATAGVDQMRDRAVNRLRFEVIELQQGQIGLLARLDAADAVVETHGFRAVQRGHAQRVARVDSRRVLRHGLAQ